jgi:hypothetical protein
VYNKTNVCSATEDLAPGPDHHHHQQPPFPWTEKTIEIEVIRTKDLSAHLYSKKAIFIFYKMAVHTTGTESSKAPEISIDIYIFLYNQ